MNDLNDRRGTPSDGANAMADTIADHLAPICDACNAAITKWIDSKPQDVLPRLGFVFGSGAAYDTTPRGVADALHTRYETWRTLVRDNKTAIKNNCRQGNHVR